jgi:FdhE protein
MQTAQSGGPDYASRIRRAQYLAARYPFAAEVLNFYERIADFQNRLYRFISRNAGAIRAYEPARLWSTPNSDAFLTLFPDMLATMQHSGTTPIRDAAHQLSTSGKDVWKEKLGEFWNSQLTPEPDPDKCSENSREPLTEFILRAFAQPFAEFAEAQTPASPTTANERKCPRCGSAPLLGVLRPEGDGGKRRLLCSFCLREWDSRRIFCAACGEEDETKLPVYVEAEQFPHIRVEACETCKFYIRTIDLTKDGNAAPMVDDLAAIPLSLWAHEHGYERIHPNLLGT